MGPASNLPPSEVSGQSPATCAAAALLADHACRHAALWRRIDVLLCSCSASAGRHVGAPPRDAQSASLATLRASPSTVFMTSPQEWGSRGLRLIPPWAPPDTRPMKAAEQHIRARDAYPDLCGVRDDPNTSLLLAQGTGLSSTMTLSRPSILSASTYDLSGAGFGRLALRRSASSLTGLRPGFSDCQGFTYSDARRVRQSRPRSLRAAAAVLRRCRAGCCAATLLPYCAAALLAEPFARSPPIRTSIRTPHRGPPAVRQQSAPEHSP